MWAPLLTIINNRQLNESDILHEGERANEGEVAQEAGEGTDRVERCGPFTASLSLTAAHMTIAIGIGPRASRRFLVC